MAKLLFAILTFVFLLPQFVLASCENSSIPGYFNNRYIDNIDGTITDRMTNLMWMKCDIDVPWDPINKRCFYNDQIVGGVSERDPSTWSEALLKTQSLNFNGFAGSRNWRLPNIKELSSILAVHCLSPQNYTALNTKFFDGDAAFYWTSTPYRDTFSRDITNPINMAWRISFKNDAHLGAVYSTIDQKLNVRLVRDAP